MADDMFAKARPLKPNGPLRVDAPQPAVIDAQHSHYISSLRDTFQILSEVNIKLHEKPGLVGQGGYAKGVGERSVAEIHDAVRKAAKWIQIPLMSEDGLLSAKEIFTIQEFLSSTKGGLGGVTINALSEAVSRANAAYRKLFQELEKSSFTSRPEVNLEFPNTSSLKDGKFIAAPLDNKDPAHAKYAPDPEILKQNQRRLENLQKIADGLGYDFSVTRAALTEDWEKLNPDEAKKLARLYVQISDKMRTLGMPGAGGRPIPVEVYEKSFMKSGGWLVRGFIYTAAKNAEATFNFVDNNRKESGKRGPVFGNEPVLEGEPLLQARALFNKTNKPDKLLGKILSGLSSALE